MGGEGFSGASITALGLAASRAVESSRADRLIDDPYALELFRAAEVDLGMRTSWPSEGDRVTESEQLHLHGSRYIGLRTRFYDDELLAAAARGVRQAVLLGAGLDTRAYRLSLPDGFTVYELDEGSVLRFKGDVLDRSDAPDRAVTRIAADLAEQWMPSLEAAGFDPRRPTAWIAEGLIAYLDTAGQERLVDTVVALSAAGSSFTFDQVTQGDVRGLADRSGFDMDSMLVGIGQTKAITGRLETAGWAVKPIDVETLARRHGRDLADPFAAPAASPAETPPWLQTEFVRAALSAPL